MFTLKHCVSAVWISSSVEGHVVSDLSYRHRSEIVSQVTSCMRVALYVKQAMNDKCFIFRPWTFYSNRQDQDKDLSRGEGAKRNSTSLELFSTSCVGIARLSNWHLVCYLGLSLTLTISLLGWRTWLAHTKGWCSTKHMILFINRRDQVGTSLIYYSHDPPEEQSGGLATKHVTIVNCLSVQSGTASRSRYSTTAWHNLQNLLSYF